MRGGWSFGIRAGFLAMVLVAAGCQPSDPSGSVVVYASQDQSYAEPIFRAFELEAGVRVRPVFDSEAVKTVGLANRLMSEQSSPLCDVFWNNEELRTRQLAAKGVWESRWASFGFRARRLVVNTNLLEPGRAPRALDELVRPEWRGRFALAVPLFGTTSTHFLALRQHWGAERWQAWCERLLANQPLLLEGNSVVVQMVGEGRVAVGLTDSDDIAAGIRHGWPLQAVPLLSESLRISNTVAIVRGTRRRPEAERLMGYVSSEAVVKRLQEVQALESEDLPGEGFIVVDWDRLLQDLEEGTTAMRSLFLK